MNSEQPDNPETPEEDAPDPETSQGPEEEDPSFQDYESALDRVLERDPRYSRQAYFFVQRALQFYREKHGGEQGGGHIRGQELLTGVRELALDEFGPMARSVLNSWGLGEGEDVGEIVYNLIEAGLMSKTPDDEKRDFAKVMRFDESLDSEASW